MLIPTLLACVLAVGQDPTCSTPEPATGASDYATIYALLEECRVEEAWERIARFREESVRDVAYFIWAGMLESCGAHVRASELLARVAAHGRTTAARARARVRLADESARCGDFDEAIRRYIEIPPEDLVPAHRAGRADVTVDLRIGFLERSRGRIDEALAAWERAARARPTLEARDAIVRTLAAHGRCDEAFAVWNREWPGVGGDCGFMVQILERGEDLREAHLLVEAGRYREARDLLEPFLDPLEVRVWIPWVASMIAEGRGAEVRQLVAGSELEQEHSAHIVLELLLRHEGMDLHELWRALLQRGPLGSQPALACELFLRTDGATTFARDELHGRDDLVALGLLAALSDPGVIAEVEARLADARDGLRDDGASLLYVLAVLGTPAAHASLWSWTGDPTLGPEAYRVSHRYAPYGRVDFSLAALNHR